LEKLKSSDGRTLQENTLSLISNVGQGLLNSNMGKGLAAIGPTVRSKLFDPANLTARVVYKLLWHLLKSHRYRMGQWTQASLVVMVFDRADTVSMASFVFLKEHFLEVDHVFRDSVKIDTAWANSIMEDSRVGHDVSIRDSLGISTVMRLLRFLPDDFTDQWLSNLVQLSLKNLSVIEALSCSPDWQPCLFQFTSELVENIAGHAASNNKKEKEGLTSEHEPSEFNGESSGYRQPDGDGKPADSNKASLDAIFKRLDLCLELYGSLLGHRVRESGEKVCTTVNSVKRSIDLPLLTS
jgi:hypothetical protein